MASNTSVGLTYDGHCLILSTDLSRPRWPRSSCTVDRSRSHPRGGITTACRYDPRWGAEEGFVKTPEAGLVPGSFRVRWFGIPALLLVAVVGATSPQAALGAGPACGVRNVSQDTTGSSLIRMVSKAVDGDKLRVRGTCPGQIVVQVDIRIVGAGEGASLTGRDRVPVLVVGGDRTVRLRGLTIEHGFTPGYPATECGGMIVRNGARVKLVDSVVRRNAAEHAICIQNHASLDFVRSVVAANTGNGISWTGPPPSRTRSCAATQAGKAAGSRTSARSRSPARPCRATGPGMRAADLQPAHAHPHRLGRLGQPLPDRRRRDLQHRDGDRHPHRLGCQGQPREVQRRWGRTTSASTERPPTSP